MFELKITVEAPEIVTALNNLSAAISGVKIPEVKVTPVIPEANVQAPAKPVAPATAVQNSAPSASMPTPVPPVQTAPPVMAPTTPANTASQAPKITLDVLARAGAAIVDKGNMEGVMALMTKYGVQTITQIQPAHYEALAADLRALGAEI